MRRAVPSPPTGNRDEDIRNLCNKRRLLLGPQHQVSIALFDRRKGCENSSADTEIHCTKVRTFFDAFEAKRETMKISGIHWQSLR